MTRRRWIADEFSADRAALIGTHAAHLSRTLRARVGQEFEVACGETVRRATVLSVADERVEFALREEISASAVRPVTLLLAVFKFDRMEWAIEKCTELNVTTIVPVIARRTEKHLANAAEKRVERWRRIAREASEQARRIAPPEITAPRKLSSLLQIESRQSSVVLTEGMGTVSEDQPRSGGTEFPGRKPWGGPLFDDVSPVGTAQHCGEFASLEKKSDELKLVLAETERTVTLADVLHANDTPRSLTFAIGPEGGWTPEELQNFTAAKFISCSLGDTILRAETAAMAALAIVRSEI